MLIQDYPHPKVQRMGGLIRKKDLQTQFQHNEVVLECKKKYTKRVNYQHRNFQKASFALFSNALYYVFLIATCNLQVEMLKRQIS
ncbi:hypothetical protein MEZE111188_19310 [Mesobacillus zeae]